MNELIVPAATSFITTMLTKGAEAPAHTFGLVWKQVFGPLDVYLEKKKLNREKELNDYALSIEKNVLEIPEEHLQEPDLSILGPALEASKYYISKEIIRDLFAEIVSASFDDRKNDLVHHSYVEIVKQLSSEDVKTLYCLEHVSGLLRLKAVSSYKGFEIIEPLILLKSYSSIQTTAISLVNLERLGLIELNFNNQLNKKELYNDFFKSEVYQEYQNFNEKKRSAYKSMFSYIETHGREKAKIDLDLDDYTIDYTSSEFHIEVDYGIARLTALGTSFFEICCK